MGKPLKVEKAALDPLLTEMIKTSPGQKATEANPKKKVKPRVAHTLLFMYAPQYWPHTHGAYMRGDVWVTPR